MYDVYSLPLSTSTSKLTKWLQNIGTVCRTRTLFSSVYPTICHLYKIKLQILVINFMSHILLLKNLLPFFPMPVPTRLDRRRDFVSGLHFNSLKAKVESEREISLSFIFLQDTTLRLWSSFQERITEPRPSVVSKEHPSKDRDSTLLLEKQDPLISLSKKNFMQISNPWYNQL